MQASNRHKIFVDADACPVRIRDIIAKAAHRHGVESVFVANKALLLPESPFLSFEKVSATPDAADQYIEENAKAGDLVITQDIPLAALLVPNGIVVIAPRGMVYSADNIADLLSRRDLMTELRDMGETVTRTPPLDETSIRKFASAFDAAVHALIRRQ